MSETEQKVFRDGKIQLVLARDFQCYQLWCNKNELPSNNRQQVRYIASERDLPGYKAENIEFVFVCDWYNFRATAEVERIRSHITMYETLGTPSRWEECT